MLLIDAEVNQDQISCIFYKVPATREASTHYGIYLNRVIRNKHRIAKVARLSN